MRTVFILFDSLNRHYLSAYGDDRVHTPNLDRLAARSAVFENHWCGSAPCMPARRDMITGRLNFLENPWCSLEPYDDSLPRELREQSGVYSHMVTDHYHYWEWPGHGYMQQFDSFEMIRGQESDQWVPAVREPETPEFRGRNKRRNWAIRQQTDMEDETRYPTPQTLAGACDFLDMNHDADNWHLHVECFDPHEPFLAPSKYREMYDDDWERPYVFDWPNYGPVDPDEEGEEAVRHVRKLYAATLTMADAWLGRFLDKMDDYGMWDDTVVILSTDHGHMLGEHGFWAKNYQFDYRELMNIPLFIYTPGAAMNGGRVTALTSAIDLMPTILDLHGAVPPPAVRGRSMLHLTERDEPHHDVVLYGYFGKDIGMTDGRYTYCRQPLPGSELYRHTARAEWAVQPRAREALQRAEVGPFLGWTDFPVYRVPAGSHPHRGAPDFNPIFDLASDPGQQHPIRDPELEARLASKLVEALEYHDAPECQFTRTGLNA